jgi:hypothetical protein
MSTMNGGCLCGGVKYTVTEEPRRVFHCNCRDCQRATGSLFQYGLMVRESSLKVEGELRSYTSKSDADRSITRLFCPTCGSSVMNRLELAPGMLVLCGGTLDEPTLKPHFELFTRSKPAWLKTDDTIPSYEAQVTGKPPR